MQNKLEFAKRAKSLAEQKQTNPISILLFVIVVLAGAWVSASTG
jgi:hypothetical protein